MIPSALEQLLENRAPYVVHFRESKSKKFPPGHWARTLCHSRKKRMTFWIIWNCAGHSGESSF